MYSEAQNYRTIYEHLIFQKLCNHHSELELIVVVAKTC